MPDLHAKDIIALYTVFAIFVLVGLKSNHSFDAILAMIIGFYFGHRKSGVDTGA
jgi:hypothetical protein